MLEKLALACYKSGICPLIYFLLDYFYLGVIKKLVQI
jgi:hypothetical protein